MKWFSFLRRNNQPLRVRRPRLGLRVEALEDRCTPAVSLQIDYSLDSNNFFAAQDRRDALDLAASTIALRLNDTLDAITPGGGNSWSASFYHPGSGQVTSLSNLSIPADTVRVYVGGRVLGGGTLANGGPGGWSGSGSATWLDTLKGRGEAGALLASGAQTDFAPWGGTLSFNTSTSWHAGLTTAGLDAGEFDLYTVAMHELTHLLGIGGAPTWTNQTSGSNFVGGESTSVYGGPVPLYLPAKDHWNTGVMSGGQIALMSPSITPATRREMTPLDWAGLDDVGWDVLTPGSAVLIGYSGGTLTLTGTDDAESLLVSAASNKIDVWVNGVLTKTYTSANSSTLTRIVTDGRGGADELTVQGLANTVTVTLTDVEKLTATSARNVVVTANSGLELGAAALTGTLSVTANGAITQTGPLTVAGTAAFAAGANAITLTNAGNNFTGAVSLANSGSNAVSVVDSNALVLGTVSVGTLAVTAGGTVSQTGTLTTSGGATFTLTAASSDLLLGAANSFAGAVVLTNNSNIRDLNYRNLAAATAVPALPSTLRTLTLTVDRAVELPPLTLTGALSVTANGAISQSGPLSVAGAATLAAGAANDITLTDAGNSFTSVAVTSARNVAIVDTGALSLGASTISGTLTVTTTGAVTQTGPLVVTGAAAVAASSVTLTANNNFGTISFTSGGAVSVTDSNGLVLGASTATGALTVTAAGAVSQSGALAVGGAVTVTAGVANDITLSHAGNAFASLAVTGRNVVVTSTQALSFRASTVTGTLAVTTAGALTQTGAVTVAGAATLTVGAGNAVTLTLANNFATVAFVNAASVAVTDSSGIALAAATITGNLTVTASGAITQTGPLIVGGTAVLSSGATNDVTLTASGNSFTAVTVTAARTVTLIDTGALSLGAATLAGALSVTTTGAVTQSGPLVVTGVATFAASSVTLTANNNFATVAVTTAGNVALTDQNAVALGNSTIGGTLTVTAAGAITQTGPLSVSGDVTLAAGTTGDIALSNVGNAFAALAVPSARNVAVTHPGALTLGASTITGNLQVTTGGALTQTAALVVQGTSAFNVGANALTLTQANNFSSAVSVTKTGAGTVSLTDVNTLILGAWSVGTGAVTVQFGGTLTQTAAFVQPAGGGTVTLTATAAATDVLLGSQANDFTGSVVIANNARDVAFRDAVGAFALPTLPASLRSLTLVYNGSAVALPALTVPGSLSVTAGGAVTQTGTLAVTGATSLTATGFDVTLTAANQFSMVAAAARNVALTDSNALDLGASTVTGTLTVTTSGAITQSGIVAVTGTATLTGGAANSITLGQANRFSTLVVTAALNVTVNDADALVLGASTVSGALNVTAAGAITQTGALAVTGPATFAAGSSNAVTLTATNSFSSVAVTSARDVAITDANALVLGTSTVSGNFTIVASGAVTQSGALRVTGTLTVTIGTFNLGLTNAGNDLGTVVVTTASNVSLVDVNALSLGTSTVSGTLSVTTAGALTQTGALAVTGLVTLNAGANGDITLSNAGNTFSTVAVTLARNATLTDATALVLGTTTVGGNLAVTAAGAITQSGALTVTGMTTLTAGGNAVTLAATGNNFGGVSIVSAGNVTLRDLNAVNLGPSVVSGTLTLTSAGAVTQTGALTVAGTTTITPGATSDVTLAHAANNFTTLAIAAARSVSVTDANALTLAASTLLGNLTVKTTGALAQTGPLVVAGTATLNVGPGSLALTNAGNNFTGAVSLVSTGAGSLSLTDANALVLGTSSLGTGAVTLRAGGSMTQTGTLSQSTLAGAITFESTAAGSGLLLDTHANAFTGTVTFANNGNWLDLGFRNVVAGAALPTLPANLRSLSVQLDAAGLALPALSLPGTLRVTVGGPLSQSGALVVTGATTLAAGANDIALTASGNNFSTVVITSGRNVSLVDANAVTLGTSTLTGTLAVTANGTIGQNGPLTVAGAATFTPAATADVSLWSANNFSSVTVAAARNVTLTDTNALTLGAMTLSGALQVTTAGALTQTGPLTVGQATFAAGTGAITLAAANDFGTVTVTSAGSLTLTDANTLNLGTVTVTGAMTLSLAGDLTQTGNVTVGGVATLAVGAGNDVDLWGLGNNFATVAVTSGRHVTVRDTSALILGTSTVGGDLSVTTAGAVTQSGAVAVAGLTTLAAGANAVTLNTAANDFAAVLVASASNVALGDQTGIVLAGSMTGSLTLTAAGAVTQSGPLTVGGAATFTVGSSNDVTLAAANAFASVAVPSANNVLVNDVNALVLGPMTLAGTLTVTTRGAITQTGVLSVAGTTTLDTALLGSVTLSGANQLASVAVVADSATIRDANALVLGPSTVAGNLHVTAGGALTQSGALTVAGMTTLVVGAANDVALDNAGNDFATLLVTSARHVVVTDATGIVLGTSAVSGDFALTASGPITQVGALTVAGTLTLATETDQAVVLSLANQFATVAIVSAGDVTLRDANALNLGDCNVSGVLTVTAGGNLTDTGTVTVLGTEQSTLNAGTFTIVLDNGTTFAGPYVAVASSVVIQ